MYENICISCFKDTMGQQICPHCGNVESGARKSTFLPARVVLHGRYLIGETLSSDKNGMCYKAFDLQAQQILEVQEHFPREMVTRDKETLSLVPLVQGEESKWPGKGVQTILHNAQTMMRFSDCEGLLRIYDVFEENNTVYIVNEYLEGLTLDDYLKQCGGVLDTETALSVVYPILDALTALHKAELVHRAVTPKNIVLTTDNTVKLINFVFLKESSAYKENDMTVYFSPGYAPYEQYVSRERRGPYTDIYSVGAVLFRMLCGKTPPDAVSRRSEEDPLRDLLEEAELPEHLVRCIAKAMDMNKDVRFKSAADLKNALQQKNEVVDIDEIIDANSTRRQYRVIGVLIAVLAALVVALVLVLDKLF